MNVLQKMASSLGHLFYPHVCRGCGTDLLESHQLLCLHCIADLPLTHFAAHEGNFAHRWSQAKQDPGAGMGVCSEGSGQAR